MNYRHAYHAGNHADILKHAVLARLILHMQKKDKPFRLMDLHAGIGIYSLAAMEAEKTLEWRDGVGRLYDIGSGRPLRLEAEAEALLAPFRQVVAELNGPGALKLYPGSPEFARRLLRPVDRLALNELHPADFETLSRAYGQDRRIGFTRMDAASAIKAQLPPPERRGLILIDPPYEVTDELARVERMVADGLRRFAGGVYAVWYPLTGDGLAAKLEKALRGFKTEFLKAEIRVRKEVAEGGLAGSGLFILNPPWQLDTELAVLLPALRARLAQGPGAGQTLSP